MDKRFTRYRNDSVDGLPDNVVTYLDEHFLGCLANLKIHNSKLLVVFSGGNAVGKSTLAQRIGHDLKGLVLENDQIKTTLSQMLPDLDRDERNAMTWKYSMGLYGRLKDLTPNGLVVRDGVIDWYYDRILPIFEQQKYELFVIGFDVSREKRMELIRKRGDKATIDISRLIALMDVHDEHIAHFRTHYTPNIILQDDNLFDHATVVEQIRAQLHT